MPLALQQLLDRIGGPRRAMLGAVGIVAVVLILVVSRWAAAPTMVPLTAGVPVESMSQYRDKLTQAGIQFQLTESGTGILVPKEEYARARIELAKGGMPGQGRPGLELFDQPSWAMTDFTQRINYRRALEGELERTIGKMRGVEQAQVHLAMQETSAFRTSDRPVEASVVLKLRSGERPGGDVVQGIAHLVAASVDGLQADRVTVVDDGGHLLSTPSDGTGIEALTSRQLATQREVEGGLRSKAEELLEQMVGARNARVQVSASLNFDRVERTSITLDPEKQVTSTEQKAEIIPGAQGGAGSTNQATSYENSRSTETYSGAPGSIRRLTVAVLVNNRRLPDAPPADAKNAKKDDAPAASAPRYAPRDSAELAQIEALVRTAVGFDSTRGDMVKVVNATFGDAVAAMEPPPPPSLGSRVQEHQRLIISVSGLVLAFAVALLALRAIKGQAGGRPELALQAATAMPQLAAAPTEQIAPAAPPIPRIVTANTVIRDRAVSSVEEQPEIAAKLVRAWMKD